MTTQMPWRKQQNFDHVIIKCNKNACGSKITVRAGDRKQEIYNWWPNLWFCTLTHNNNIINMRASMR